MCEWSTSGVPAEYRCQAVVDSGVPVECQVVVMDKCERCLYLSVTVVSDV